MAVGAVYRVIQSLFGGKWRPLEIHLPWSAARSRAYYRQVLRLRGRVQFRIRRDPAAPRATSSGGFRRPHPLIARYRRKPRRGVRGAARSMGCQGRQLVRMLLPAGDCSIERVAEHLGVRPPHHPPAPGRMRHDVLENPRRRARRDRHAPGRGTLASAGRDRRDGRLFRAERHGALVPRTLRLQHHRMAQRSARANADGGRPLVSIAWFQAARTESRNLPTSSLRRLLSPDSSCAADSTCVDDDPVSVAPCRTSAMCELT